MSECQQISQNVRVNYLSNGKNLSKDKSLLNEVNNLSLQNLSLHNKSLTKLHKLVELNICNSVSGLRCFV